MEAVVAAADAVRTSLCGDGVSYVVNRNINYTNICTYACRFCAFSKVRCRVALDGLLGAAGTARGAGIVQGFGAVQRGSGWRAGTHTHIHTYTHWQHTGNTLATHWQHTNTRAVGQGWQRRA
jgi:hypothetical protein